MTLATRIALITAAVREVEERFPLLSSSALIEVASASLAHDHGLCVSPDEIVQTLADAAAVTH